MKKFISCFILFLLFVLSSCDGGGGGGSGTTQNPISNQISFTLPPGNSSEETTVNGFSLLPNFTGSLFLALSSQASNVSNLQIAVTSSDSNVMQVTVLGSNNATKSTLKDPGSNICVLNSGSNQTGCNIQIKSFGIGTTYITSTVIGSYANQGITIQNFPITVLTTPVPGNIDFDSQNYTITNGSNGSAVLSLVGSGAVSNLSVNIISSDSNIVSVTPASCTLNSDANRSCMLTLTGITNGSANIIASANGYASTTAHITVSNAIVPGNIAFNQSTDGNLYRILP